MLNSYQHHCEVYFWYPVSQINQESRIIMLICYQVSTRFSSQVYFRVDQLRFRIGLTHISSHLALSVISCELRVQGLGACVWFRLGFMYPSRSRNPLMH